MRSKSPIFALVDCNNFYASCERVFDPRLEGKPIVILSSNDGCVIARSNEAKALSIPMGAPFYQYRDVCQQHKVVVRSSNFTLYGDFSERVMESLKSFYPDVEIYSIDEAFLRLESMTHHDVVQYAQSVRSKIKQWTGIPVSIGISTTKTLAKVANHMAKRHSQVGVYDLREPSIRDKVLQQFPVESVWGIGQALNTKLKSLNINTAFDLQQSDLSFLRRRFSVVVERTAMELRGVACIELENAPKAQQSIISSRSFGKALSELPPIQEALSNYVARACEKLRQQRLKAYGIQVFLTPKSFYQADNYSTVVTLLEATQDTRTVIAYAKASLEKLYKPGESYRKVGVRLLNLVSDNLNQRSLFAEDLPKNSEKLMRVIDKINQQMGKDTVFLAAQGTHRPWQPKSETRSPRYTTDWGELVKVKC